MTTNAVSDRLEQHWEIYRRNLSGLDDHSERVLKSCFVNAYVTGWKDCRADVARIQEVVDLKFRRGES